MLTVKFLTEKLNSGSVTARELVIQAYDKIADPAGEGERVFVHLDKDNALATADYIDGLRGRNAQPSPYAGIPIAVKDLFDLSGQVTKAGSKVLADQPPAKQDASAIARLKAQGFIVLGRSNMTEFAYSGVGLNPHYGTPLSSYDRATGRIPGGSSSGAGVSVGDGIVSLSIGTDTGGSCRIPAAYNGVVGYKSSSGRVSKQGVFPLSVSLDTVGPLAVSVGCAAIGDAVMAGDWDGVIDERPLAGLRLGVLQTVVLDDLDEHVAADYARVCTTLSVAGAVLSDITFTQLADLPTINSNGGISAVEACGVHKGLIECHGDDYDQRVRRRILTGRAITGPEIDEIRSLRHSMINAYDRVSAGFDAVIMPTTSIIPPAISELDKDEDYNRLNFLSLRNTFVGNFLDLCAISLPMHRPEAAPTGLMIFAPHGADQRLFSIAQAVEATLG